MNFDITIKPTANENEYCFEFPKKRGERKKYAIANLIYHAGKPDVMGGYIEYPYGSITIFYPNGRNPQESEQGLGRGTAMLEKMLEFFKDQNMKQVFCYTDNPRMMKLLSKCNFSIVDENRFIKNNYCYSVHMPTSFSQVER